ncbi:MAG TPA: hypothetical protein VLJ15_08150 [Gammaproteobacteria bacterium]|nr:hypothetical protein [Gammaproteobacteria bacterium]
MAQNRKLPREASETDRLRMIEELRRELTEQKLKSPEDYSSELKKKYGRKSAIPKLDYTEKSPTARLKHLLARATGQEDTSQGQIAKYIKGLQQSLNTDEETEIDLSDPLAMHAFVRIVEEIRQASDHKNREKDFFDTKLNLALRLLPDTYPYDEVYRITLESAVVCNELDYAWELLKECVEENLVFMNDFSYLRLLMEAFSRQKSWWHVKETYTRILCLLNKNEERIATLKHQNFQAFKELHHTAMREMAKFPETSGEVHHIYHCLTTYRRGKFADEKTFAITIAALCHRGEIENAIDVFRDAEEKLTPRKLSLLHCDLRQPEYQYAEQNINEMYSHMRDRLEQFPPGRPSEVNRIENYSLSDMLLAGMGLLPETESERQELPTDILEQEEKEYDELTQPAPSDPTTPKPATLPNYASSHAVLFHQSTPTAPTPALPPPSAPRREREFSFGGYPGERPS